MLYTKTPTDLNGAFEIREATLEDYKAMIPEAVILQLAEECLFSKINNGEVLCDSYWVKKYLSAKIATKEREVFGILVLDAQNRLITDEILFQGSFDSSRVYPREVLKCVMKHNAKYCIAYHNHPSGDPDPSQSDRQLTTTLVNALQLIDCQMLDHLVIGVEGIVSFSEKNWM
ncbi:JAB domain-containing protein [Vibrio cholerae]|uniref:JAB domain-containing protein n=1 Tax=Vibrio cholerae TaxID=666 RepID=UPI0012EB60B3|nr:JAB domain-containing protein [Vibrio cholerae]MBY4642020.1 hypothetical protein [Vibrio cholerae]MCR9658292.1 hypothetical protein [Vibrio cholerae]MCR9688973.1 hypothetical protein [Vibrio cholerae]MCR9737481.1 hypothetical protein [Vibrio cholerae]MCR9746304.1 hypothetical protein [Vibrio cholerae]